MGVAEEMDQTNGDSADADPFATPARRRAVSGGEAVDLAGCLARATPLKESIAELYDDSKQMREKLAEVCKALKETVKDLDETSKVQVKSLVEGNELEHKSTAEKAKRLEFESRKAQAGKRVEAAKSVKDQYLYARSLAQEALRVLVEDKAHSERRLAKVTAKLQRAKLEEDEFKDKLQDKRLDIKQIQTNGSRLKSCFDLLRRYCERAGDPTIASGIPEIDGVDLFNGTSNRALDSWVSMRRAKLRRCSARRSGLGSTSPAPRKSVSSEDTDSDESSVGPCERVPPAPSPSYAKRTTTADLLDGEEKIPETAGRRRGKPRVTLKAAAGKAQPAAQLPETSTAVSSRLAVARARRVPRGKLEPETPRSVPLADEPEPPEHPVKISRAKEEDLPVLPSHPEPNNEPPVAAGAAGDADVAAPVPPASTPSWKEPVRKSPRRLVDRPAPKRGAAVASAPQKKEASKVGRKRVPSASSSSSGEEEDKGVHLLGREPLAPLSATRAAVKDRVSSSSSSSPSSSSYTSSDSSEEEEKEPKTTEPKIRSRLAGLESPPWQPPPVVWSPPPSPACEEDAATAAVVVSREQPPPSSSSSMPTFDDAERPPSPVAPETPAAATTAAASVPLSMPMFDDAVLSPPKRPKPTYSILPRKATTEKPVTAVAGPPSIELSDVAGTGITSALAGTAAPSSSEVLTETDDAEFAAELAGRERVARGTRTKLSVSAVFTSTDGERENEAVTSVERKSPAGTLKKPLAKLKKDSKIERQLSEPSSSDGDEVEKLSATRKLGKSPRLPKKSPAKLREEVKSGRRVSVSSSDEEDESVVAAKKPERTPPRMRRKLKEESKSERGLFASSSDDEDEIGPPPGAKKPVEPPSPSPKKPAAAAGDADLRPTPAEKPGKSPPSSLEKLPETPEKRKKPERQISSSSSSTYSSYSSSSEEEDGGRERSVLQKDAVRRASESEGVERPPAVETKRGRGVGKSLFGSSSSEAPDSDDSDDHGDGSAEKMSVGTPKALADRKPGRPSPNPLPRGLVSPGRGVQAAKKLPISPFKRPVETTSPKIGKPSPKAGRKTESQVAELPTPKAPTTWKRSFESRARNEKDSSGGQRLAKLVAPRGFDVDAALEKKLKAAAAGAVVGVGEGVRKEPEPASAAAKKLPLSKPNVPSASSSSTVTRRPAPPPSSRKPPRPTAPGSLGPDSQEGDFMRRKTSKPLKFIPRSRLQQQQKRQQESETPKQKPILGLEMTDEDETVKREILLAAAEIRAAEEMRTPRAEIPSEVDSDKTAGEGERTETAPVPGPDVSSIERDLSMSESEEEKKEEEELRERNVASTPRTTQLESDEKQDGLEIVESTSKKTEALSRVDEEVSAAPTSDDVARRSGDTTTSPSKPTAVGVEAARHVPETGLAEENVEPEEARTTETPSAAPSRRSSRIACRSSDKSGTSRRKGPGENPVKVVGPERGRKPGAATKRTAAELVSVMPKTSGKKPKKIPVQEDEHDDDVSEADQHVALVQTGEGTSVGKESRLDAQCSDDDRVPEKSRKSNRGSQLEPRPRAHDWILKVPQESKKPGSSTRGKNARKSSIAEGPTTRQKGGKRAEEEVEEEVVDPPVSKENDAKEMEKQRILRVQGRKRRAAAVRRRPKSRTGWTQRTEGSKTTVMVANASDSSGGEAVDLTVSESSEEEEECEEVVGPRKKPTSAAGNKTGAKKAPPANNGRAKRRRIVSSSSEKSSSDEDSKKNEVAKMKADQQATKSEEKKDAAKKKANLIQEVFGDSSEEDIGSQGNNIPSDVVETNAEVNPVQESFGVSSDEKMLDVETPSSVSPEKQVEESDDEVSPPRNCIEMALEEAGAPDPADDDGEERPAKVGRPNDEDEGTDPEPSSSTGYGLVSAGNDDDGRCADAWISTPGDGDAAPAVGTTAADDDSSDEDDEEGDGRWVIAEVDEDDEGGGGGGRSASAARTLSSSPAFDPALLRGGPSPADVPPRSDSGPRPVLLPGFFRTAEPSAAPTPEKNPVVATTREETVPAVPPKRPSLLEDPLEVAFRVFAADGESEEEELKQAGETIRRLARSERFLEILAKFLDGVDSDMMLDCRLVGQLEDSAYPAAVVRIARAIYKHGVPSDFVRGPLLSWLLRGSRVVVERGVHIGGTLAFILFTFRLSPAPSKVLREFFHFTLKSSAWTIEQTLMCLKIMSSNAACDKFLRSVCGHLSQKRLKSFSCIGCSLKKNPKCLFIWEGEQLGDFPLSLLSVLAQKRHTPEERKLVGEILQASKWELQLNQNERKGWELLEKLILREA